VKGKQLKINKNSHIPNPSLMTKLTQEQIKNKIWKSWREFPGQPWDQSLINK
jgi:hypothetical protein